MECCHLVHSTGLLLDAGCTQQRLHNILHWCSVCCSSMRCCNWDQDNKYTQKCLHPVRARALGCSPQQITAELAASNHVPRVLPMLQGVRLYADVCLLHSRPRSRSGTCPARQGLRSLQHCEGCWDSSLHSASRNKLSGSNSTSVALLPGRSLAQVAVGAMISLRDCCIPANLDSPSTHRSLRRRLLIELPATSTL